MSTEISTGIPESSYAGLLFLLAGSLIFMGIITAEIFYPAGYTTANSEISDLGATSATRSDKSDCYPGLKPVMPSNPFWVSLPARACLATNGCEAAGTKW